MRIVPSNSNFFSQSAQENNFLEAKTKFLTAAKKINFSNTLSLNFLGEETRIHFLTNVFYL